MTVRDIKDLAAEVDREATILTEKMRKLNLHLLQGVRYVDDETFEAVYPDNVVPFGRSSQ